MAGIFDRMRNRLRGRQAPNEAGQEMMPEEQQGWGQMPAGNAPAAWNRPQAEDDGADIDALSRIRTTQEDDAYRMGERMAAEGIMRLNGAEPKTLHAEGQSGGIDRERLNRATDTLLKYKAGKASIDRRIIAAQQWWKLKNWEEIRKNRGVRGSTRHPSNTGWLWNCIVGKHADMIDCYPEPVILPRMMDDQEEAKKLSSIIPVVMEMNDFEETYNNAMWQKMQEGTGVYGVFWNSSKLNGLGDIDIKKVNMLQLYWEPGINDIQDSRNVFYVSFENKDDLVRMYPELEGKLGSNRLSIEQYKTDDSVDLSDKVPVIDWYYKVRQEGKTILHYCKYVNETVLYSSEEENPEGFYEDGKYPFVLDALFPVEGSPAGYGYIDIARDTQADIDTLSQAMVKNAEVSATPRYFARKDGGINEEEFSDLSKPIVHTNGNLGTDTLRQVDVPVLSAGAQNMLQQKIDEIKFITGNTDINNGGVPSGVTAASAIAALKEDSGRSSKDSTKASYRSYRLIVTMVIERIRQFYDLPRQFRILGQQNGQEQFEVYSNAGLKMQTIDNGGMMENGLRLPVFDIEVRAQRENAYTKMSQNELALQFWGNGMLNPQMTDQALIVLDMMEFRGKDDLKRKLQTQGTLQDTLMKVAQIALQLAQKYDPMAAQQLAGVVQSVMGDAGMAPVMAGAAPAGLQPGQEGAPQDEMRAPEQGSEPTIVRRAKERAANASRPD